MFSADLGVTPSSANYIEDVFSTYLYTGNGSINGVPAPFQFSSGATTPGWIATLNAIGTQFGRDSSNNVYLCADNNLIKYNSSGGVIWQTTLNNSGSLNAIAVTSVGDCYISSSQSSPTGFGIVKYNSSGVVQWQRTLTMSYNASRHSIALDSSENVYVAVSTIATGGVYNQGVLVKYNSSGTLQWQRTVERGTSSNDGTFLRGIAVDSAGNVYICGYTRDFLADIYYYIIQKYNTSGTVQWQRKMTTASTNTSDWSGIALSSDGADVYVIGTTYSLATYSNYLVKYNSSGTLQWQKLLRNGLYGNSVTVDSSNNVYVGGSNNGPNFYGIVKYNSLGTVQWQRTLSRATTAGSLDLRSITADSSGNVFVGCTSGSAAFVAKLPADGSGGGAYIVGNEVYTYAPSNYTEATETQTNSSDSLTISTSTFIGGTSSFTSSTPSLTSSTTNLIEGGAAKDALVWLKGRSSSADHALYDTIRGATLDLASNLTTGQTTQTTGLTGFLSNGFSIGSLAKLNTSAATYTSWTFRKQAKFFDVVTYTGNGTSQNIAHSLGATPGCIIVKCTSAADDWRVYHRSLATVDSALRLNSTASVGSSSTFWNSTAPTATQFTVGSNGSVNASGATYVAYLFAHDAGGFGATGTDNVISCGSYTGNSSSTGPTITLGYEPQWVMVKAAGPNTGNWYMFDNMRGMPVGINDERLYANTSDAEITGGTYISPQATGFQITNPGSDFNASGNTYIYIAIRRGPMKTPTTGTSVFSPIASSAAIGTKLTTNFPVDFLLTKYRSGAASNAVVDRLRGVSTNATEKGSVIYTNSTAAEAGTAGESLFWNNTGFQVPSSWGGFSNVYEAFRRAPGFFDIVCYTGTGANTTQTHNLGVVPELIIVKRRSTARDWTVYSAPTGNANALILNLTSASTASSSVWNSTTPTASVFSLGASLNVNSLSETYVAYLFATVAGVSKVGSYTGTGTTNQINCGFTGGARFVLIKRTDSTGDWYVWDSARGIVAGNDPYFLLNSSAAEVTSTDYVDTYSAGFEISSTAPAAINANGGSFIFLAIA